MPIPGERHDIVWGPPGTGKTTTLARIVEAHYRVGRSVLLVSNTNIAVDTALERVAERLKGESDFHQGLVIRQGLVVKNELRQKFGPQIILDEIVARLGESLRRQKAELAEESAPLESEERSLVATLKDIERLAHARLALARGENARDSVKSNLAERQQEAQHDRERATKQRNDLERTRKMGTLRRFFSGLHLEVLEREASASERAAQAADEAARALAADLPTFEAEIGSLRDGIDRLLLKIQAQPPEAEVQARLGTLRTRLGSVRQRVAAIDRELAELKQQVVARCKILATTVYQTYLGKNPLRQFDVVVVDEASMLMPPLVYHAAGLATQSVTIAGDFRQLPPIVISNEPLTKKWLKRDVFEIADIPQRLALDRPIPHLVALTTQYRMREPICAVINKLFYHDHPLRSDLSVNRTGEDFPFGPGPLFYVDTAAFHPWAAHPAGSRTRYNLFHALLVRNLILNLSEKGFLLAKGGRDAVGVVTPYFAQARLIQALLDERLTSSAAGIAHTVHRFQGNEKRAMVLDLTDSLGVPLGQFLQATQLEEDGARLLNVATSRARDHVVLVGNFEYLRAKAPKSGFVRRLVDHFEENGEALDLDNLLPLTEQDWMDGLHRILPPTFDFPEAAAGAFTEGTFYPAFLNDICRAEQSIVILSPFATDRGTSRWVDPLRVALARGVRVRILTKPPQESGGGTAAEVATLVGHLRDQGVTVDLRARMHEKMAILDGHILWHGSLNILSHRDTHESMLRIESPRACQVLGRFLSSPKGRRDESPTPGAPENPQCPQCGSTTVWNDGRFGIWFECEDPACDGKVDPHRRGSPREESGARRPAGGSRRRPVPQGPSALDQRTCPEQGCGGRLAGRRGRYGPFLGCSNYPICRYTEDLD